MKNVDQTWGQLIRQGKKLFNMEWSTSGTANE